MASGRISVNEAIDMAQGKILPTIETGGKVEIPPAENS